MSFRSLRSLNTWISEGRVRLLFCWLALGAGLANAMAMQPQAARQPGISSYFQEADRDMQSGNSAGAEGELRAILALDPANTEAHTKLGFVLFMRGSWAQAASNLQQALTGQPDLVNAQAVLGMCEKRLGKLQEARGALERAFPKLPDGRLKIQAGLDWAEILYDSDDLDRAVDVVRAVLPLDPKNPDVLYTAARVYADLANRSRDALALAAPDSGRTHQLMAEFLINTGDTHAAIAEFRKALELSPMLGGVHYELGDAILLDSREPPSLDTAEKEFRTALAENPSDANAEYRLGTICSLRKDYKAAVDYYTRTLQRRPGNAHAEQELGWAWFKLGDAKRGLSHLVAAARLDPLFPTPRYQLGMVYRQMGQEADSQRELAAFEKLEGSRKRIDQVYYRARPRLKDGDVFGSGDPPD
ncbi:MAG TPA: tetratricopeptide repeat protein [Terriglobia bacterium]|nr:tetratricopeptide repeat protein [Terriglobia bacterium]